MPWNSRLERMTITTYFWLCTMAILGKLSADCPYQACICVSDFIECSARSPILTKIPALISTNTSGLTALDFSANQITAIHSGQLPPKLTEISFLENPITTIDDHAFHDSLTTLEKLSFSNCGITRIPTALYRLSKLKMLHIFNARITEWNIDVMKNIGPTVEELYLMNAGISPSLDWLLYFKRLKMLILDGCSVFSVPDDALHEVANTLTHLSLANNNLPSIPSTIVELRSLKVLALQSNSISDISSLPNSDQMVTLFLHNNNISDVHLMSDKLQRYNESLITLSLNNNNFLDLDFLTQVGILDLSHNQISNANSGSVPWLVTSLNLQYNSLPSIPTFMSDLILLEDIILSYNVIQEIRATDFPTTPVNLDLEHNLIKMLTNTSFPENSTIVFLNLNDNPIVDISFDVFKNLPALKELRLQKSKLTRLPLTFPMLTSLYLVDLTNSTELVCTCAEKSLESWVTSLSPANVVGSCGDTSIYTFFVMLSPACP